MAKSKEKPSVVDTKDYGMTDRVNQTDKYDVTNGYWLIKKSWEDNDYDDPDDIDMNETIRWKI